MFGMVSTDVLYVLKVQCARFASLYAMALHHLRSQTILPKFRARGSIQNALYIWNQIDAGVPQDLSIEAPPIYSPVPSALSLAYHDSSSYK